MMVNKPISAVTSWRFLEESSPRCFRSASCLSHSRCSTASSWTAIGFFLISFFILPTLALGLGKGHQILVKRGMQTFALVDKNSTFNLTTCMNANFTGVYWIWVSNSSLLGPAPGVTWGRWASSEADMPCIGDEIPYAENLLAVQLGDEQNLNDPAVRAAVAAWFANVRDDFPNTILYCNSYGGQVTNPNLGDFIVTSQPDMLSFDTYPFRPGEPLGGSPVHLYGDMQRYRKWSLSFGLPYAMYTQTFYSVGENYREPSESELRLNYFAGLTYGYTFFNCFTYNTGATSLFYGPGDSSPKPDYYQITETNRRLRNLSPSLTRLVSSYQEGVYDYLRFINGQHLDGSTPVYNQTPVDVLVWNSSAGVPPYLQSVEVTNLGTKNNSLPGDVWISRFKALDESFDGPYYSGEVYFMVTNGLSDPAGTPAECRQRIKLNFNFGSSGITSLQRLNSDTGRVEDVPLEVITGGRRLTLDIDGGTGDLFKFKTAAPFIGTIYFVDDDASGDPSPGNPASSDPLEDGSSAHPFDSIAEAIAVSKSTYKIIVYPGTYYENINLGGKDIILTSTDPDNPAVVAATIINGGGVDTVVKFAGAETAACQLTGFTITNGAGSGTYGGGVYGSMSSATISRCVITGNTSAKGGGIRSHSGTISHCWITDNSVSETGGGLAGCTASINNCLIADNTAAGYGGGINNCDGDIVNCTVAENSAPAGGGIKDCDGTITNCIIWGNSPDAVNNSSSPTYSCYPGAGGTGNISADPCFVDGPSADYHLRCNSPCIDGGTNSPPGGLSNTDLDGGSRLLNGDNNGTTVVDMGAYEYAFNPAQAATIELTQNEMEFSLRIGDADPNDQVLGIRNSGSCSLFWQVAENCSWLEVLPASGESNGEIDDVTVSVNVTGLTVGAYNCNLTVTGVAATNSPQTVAVKLSILDADGVLYVPAEYGTIQAAIDAAGTGDTVIVAPGSYPENIHFIDRDIILTSTNPTDPNIVASTVIDGGGLNTTVRFAGAETAACQLRGFTITGGAGPGLDGGGIHGNSCLAAISYCNLTGNTSASKGGGIKVIYGTISHCRITGNTTGTQGGGLAGCMGNISNCLIADNSATNGGGGLNNCDGSIINCTIVNNSAGSGGGVKDCDGTIINCIIWGNSPDALNNSSSPTYSCYPGAGGTGNISADPLFTVGLLGDYYLSQTASGQSANSPCLDTGSDTAANLAMDNFTTRTDSVSDLGIIDMGYHYTSNLADLDKDGVVDLADLAIFASQWLAAPGNPSADLAPAIGDDFVDLRDFDTFVKNWLWSDH